MYPTLEELRVFIKVNEEHRVEKVTEIYNASQKKHLNMEPLNPYNKYTNLNEEVDRLDNLIYYNMLVRKFYYAKGYKTVGYNG